MCSRELPPAKIVSDSSDMEQCCTPCANAAKGWIEGSKVEGFQERADREVVQRVGEQSRREVEGWPEQIFHARTAVGSVVIVLFARDAV